MHNDDIEQFDSTSAWFYVRKNADQIRDHVAIKQGLGDKDPHLERNHRMNALLDELKIPHEYKELPGVGHDTKKVYTLIGVEGWKFHAAHFAVPKAGAGAFQGPKMDETRLGALLDKETENQYTGGVVHGVGKGRAGWGADNEAGILRFIHLNYGCEGSRDGLLDGSHGDGNFLRQLHDVSGLKTAEEGETFTAQKLGSRKAGFQPPLIFMTGQGGFEMSSTEMVVLREYLLSGGMIFADSGGEKWDAAFLAWVTRLLPDNSLAPIPADDVIYHAWFHIPDGAGALPLQHGRLFPDGDKRNEANALGVRHGDRWVIFYVRSNMHSAWKTEHIKADPAAWKRSSQLGVNVVYYAIMNFRKQSPPDTRSGN
jgi:hypothetical protein